MQCRRGVECIIQRPGVKDYTVFKESGGFHYLIKDVDSVAPLNTYKLLRMATLFYYLCEITGNFQDISGQIFDMMVKTSDVI